MEEVIHYLELKNRYYEKFYTVTLRFIEGANEGDWKDIDAFIDTREKILSIIRQYEFKIAQAFESTDCLEQDLSRYQAQVHEHMKQRQAWVRKIITLDLELIGRLDEIKTENIRDLKRQLEGTFTATTEAHSRSPKLPKET